MGFDLGQALLSHTRVKVETSLLPPIDIALAGEPADGAPPASDLGSIVARFLKPRVTVYTAPSGTELVSVAPFGEPSPIPLIAIIAGFAFFILVLVLTAR